MFNKKIPHGGRDFLDVRKPENLCSFPNFARLDAVRAHAHTTHAALHDGSHPLQIGKEPTGGSVMGMAHVVSRHWFLTTNFTNPCHRHSLQKQ